MNLLHVRKRCLSTDFLSPAITAMVFPDLLQQLIPFPITFLDRGRSLERSWEEACRNALGSNQFASSFFDLSRDPTIHVPALFLNGTSVEHGNRVILSNLLISSGFIDSTDAYGELLPPEQHAERRHTAIDIRLSAVVLFSARFAYVSPVGRLSDDSHVVDGGYFENSGCATAFDLIEQIHQIIIQDRDSPKIIPLMIVISNDPFENIRSRSRSSQLMHEITGPLHALLRAREARSPYAVRILTAALRHYSDAVPSAANNGSRLYYFSLAPANVPLPLGWMLSSGAAKAMQDEMYDKGLSSNLPTSVGTWNQAEMARVIECLKGTETASGNNPSLKP